MKVAIFQIIMIADMIKVEFKISSDNGVDAYLEQMIENRKQYEKFKKDIAEGIASLDDIINHKLKINELRANNTSDVSAVEHQPAKV